MEEWQKQRLDFYIKSGASQFISKYLDVKDGIRCISSHPREYPKRGRIQYEYNAIKGTQRMYRFYPELLTKYNCIHSFMYTFDKKVLEWVDQDVAINLYRASTVGINAIIEIDSPYKTEKEGSPRLDIMDFIPELNKTLSIIIKRLDELGEEYYILFSGNGVYIILEGYYPRLDNEIERLQDYKDNFINLFENLQKDGFGNPLKVHIDNSGAPWNDYMKIPFTFHEKKPRMSIPLSKEEIDGKWLRQVSDVNNIMNDYSIINEIIKKANWEKLW